MAADKEIKLVISGDGSVAIASMQKVTEASQKMSGDVTGHHKTLFDMLNTEWAKFTAMSVAGLFTVSEAFEKVHQAMELMKEGAKAMQVEKAFENTAHAMGVSVDGMVEKLKELTNYTIDDSDLMAKAMKAMTGVAALSADEIYELAEISRLSARRMGVDVGEAYNKIIDSVETMKTKALVQYGLISKGQKEIIDKAKEMGIEVKITEIAWLNYQVQLEKMGKPETDAIERMQQHEAAIKGFKEELGKLLITIAGVSIEWGKSFLSGTTAAANAMSGVVQTEADLQRLGLIKGGEKPASEIAKSKDPQKELADRLDAIKKQTEAEKARQSAMADAQNLEKSINEEIRRAQVETATMGMSQYDKDMARIDSMAQKYREAGAGEVTIARYVAEERKLARAKSQEVENNFWMSVADAARAAEEKEMEAIGEDAKRRIALQEQLDNLTRSSSIIGQTDNEKAVNDITLKYSEQFKKLNDLRSSGYADSLADKAQFDKIEIDLENAKDRELAALEIKRRSEISKINFDLINDIRGYEAEAFNARVQAINDYADKEVAKGADRVNANAWVADQVERATDEMYKRMLLSSDHWEIGFRAALIDLKNRHYTWSMGIYEVTSGMFRNMESSFSNIFYDAFTGKLKDFSDYWSSFWDSMYKVFADFLAKLAMANIGNFVLGSLGTGAQISLGGLSLGTGSGGSLGLGAAGLSAAGLGSKVASWLGIGGTSAASGAAASSAIPGLIAGGLTEGEAGSLAGMSAWASGYAGAGAAAGGSTMAGMMASLGTVAPFILPALITGYGLMQGAHGAAPQTIFNQTLGNLSDISKGGGNFVHEGNYIAPMDAKDLSKSIKDLELYGQEFGVLREQVLALTREALGPAYDSMVNMAQAMIDAESNTSGLSGAVGILTRDFNLTTSQSADLTRLFMDQDQTTNHLNETIQTFAEMLGTTQEQARSLAQALGMIPTELSTTYSFNTVYNGSPGTPGSDGQSGASLPVTWTEGSGQSSTWYPSAYGNVFNSGMLIPFARGGIIDRPAVFPMALMGEAGPEAILPLKRGADGRLGVQTNGQNQVNVRVFIGDTELKGIIRTEADSVITGRNQRGVNPSTRIY